MTITQFLTAIITARFVLLPAFKKEYHIFREKISLFSAKNAGNSTWFLTLLLFLDSTEGFGVPLEFKVTEIVA